ncbi:MAG: hypothetical protein C0391_03240 [Anaerolinea sp.]|nr:hypothetical protein [Anaerolinea sp.]
MIIPEYFLPDIIACMMKPIKVILFDWGDTVMRALPGSQGPMFKWKHVEAMPGIQTALQHLAAKYPLYLATNAADSSPLEIHAALARVGVDDYFTDIFTASKMGCAKPQINFYNHILETLNLSAGEVVMVGDDLTADIAGAFNAGIRAIWVQANFFIPMCSHPLQSAELLIADQLPSVIEHIQHHTLPELDECAELLMKHVSHPGLHKHVFTVSLVAYFLARLAQHNGLSLDPILAHRGGLLHDLDKLETVNPDNKHGAETARILNELGYAQLARIAISHSAFTILDPVTAPNTLEEQIVYLADKMCEGDKIVDVDTRFANFRKRYPNDLSLFNQSLSLINKMESDLHLSIAMKNDKLMPYLQRKVSFIG